MITNKPEQVLDNVKVLDFGWALAGSLTTKHLADHGAKVVKIESIKRLDRDAGRAVQTQSGVIGIREHVVEAGTAQGMVEAGGLGGIEFLVLPQSIERPAPTLRVT